MLPVDLIPVTRAVYRLTSTTGAVDQVEARVRTAELRDDPGSRLDANRQAVADELVAAIERRVAERAPAPWYHRGTGIGLRSGHRRSKVPTCADARPLQCGRGESNPHARRHQILSLAWLPLHHSRVRPAV
jgi:hypothetical protein